MSFHSISIPHEILRDLSVLWHDIWEQKNIAETQGNNFKYFWEIYFHISENITRFLDKKNTSSSFCYLRAEMAKWCVRNKV